MIKHSYVSFCAVASLALLAACGSGQAPTSKLDGHYEESSATAMEPFAGSQFARPEYRPSRGVIISLPLLNEYGKAQMAADMLATGIDTLWITVPSSYRGTLEGPDFAELRQLAGSTSQRITLVPQRESGPITVWARDWAPLGALTHDGSLRLLDFNYYPERGADDATARSLLAILPVPRVSVPVYNEGGNFMNNDRGDCLMSSRVTEANAEAYFAEDMILSEDEIKDYYQRYAGCQNVSIFPRMPHEGTGHIDMWAKFLDDDTVLVAELRNEIRQLGGYTTSQRQKLANIATYLENRAREIARRGYEVVRIPMPAPVFSPGGDIFRSYTNALTLNGHALVPRYRKPYSAEGDAQDLYPDNAYIAAYEREVRAIYEANAYRVTWVDSDDLIAWGGAVHCTTMQIAR